MGRSDIISKALKAETHWRNFLEMNVSGNKYSEAKLKDFYNALSFEYAMKVGYTEDTTYRLSVFEILNGKTFSPEFILLSDVMPVTLLHHYALFLLETSPEKLIGFPFKSLENTPVVNTFEKDNENIRKLWFENREFVENMLFTRVISSYDTYCKLIEKANESLRLVESDLEYYKSIGVNTRDEGFDEMEMNIKANIESYEVIVNLIEILFDSGATVYSPSELKTFVDSYLSNLVKRNEELLNPFVKSERKNSVLPGELRIQAFVESSTGKDWILPR